MKFQETLAALLAGRNLTASIAEALFVEIFQGKISPRGIKTVLLLLAKKSETAAEITGCLKALRRCEPQVALRVSNAIDTCGTGGDGSQSMNVSTVAAFVIAGAGGRVAKHGNRGISSKCGSSDLMEALGVKLESDAVKMTKAIETCGLGYFHAPFHHPVFATLQPIRKSLRTKTIFNLIGPLANPVQIKRQLIGVANPKLVRLYAQVLEELKVERAWVFHSDDGLDEISSAAKTRVIEIQKGKTRTFTIDPKAFGFKKVPVSAFAVKGDVRKRAETARDLLAGRLHGPLEELILVNAAAGLVVGGQAPNIKEGLFLAEDSIRSGRALKVLEKLKK